MKNLTQFKDIFRFYTEQDGRSKSGSARLTLEEISATLGYKSPSSLSMIATGVRLPSKDLLEKLMELWKLSAKDKKILRLQLEIEKRQKKDKDTLTLLNDLKKMDPASKYTQVNLDVFETVKDWHFYALKNFVGAPSFSEDPEELSRYFRRKISPAKIKKALATMERLKLIERNAETQQLQKSHGPTETTHEIPSEAIRKHHLGMIRLALDSIDEQSVENRAMNSVTIRFNKNRMLEIKRRLLGFIKQINAEFYDDTQDPVYQLNLQFFELTKFELENKSKDRK